MDIRSAIRTRCILLRLQLCNWRMCLQEKNMLKSLLTASNIVRIIKDCWPISRRIRNCDFIISQTSQTQLSRRNEARPSCRLSVRAYEWKFAYRLFPENPKIIQGLNLIPVKERKFIFSFLFFSLLHSFFILTIYSSLHFFQILGRGKPFRSYTSLQ